MLSFKISNTVDSIPFRVRFKRWFMALTFNVKLAQRLHLANRFETKST